MKLIDITEKNYPQAAKIFTDGLKMGSTTFETKVPTWIQWNASHLPYCRIALVKNKTIVGWAALSSISKRVVYAGVAEINVYVAEDERGKGYGKQLLEALILESENHNVWSLQSSIMGANSESLILHLHFGFRIIGHREKIAKHDGQWLDNILLERRSNITGI